MNLSLIKTNNSDTLTGGTKADHLYGMGGNDSINGGDGNDYLDGGADNDILFGGDDSDTLLGGAGSDELQGGMGTDMLDGGAGNDILFGEDGNDTLMGGTGQDELYGGEGNDTLIGTGDGDTLVGGAGVDTIYLKGLDVLAGQDALDKIIYLDTNNLNTATASGSTNSALGDAGVTINVGNAMLNLFNGLVADSDATFTFADGSQIKQNDLLGGKLNSFVNINSESNAIFGGLLNDNLQAIGIANTILFGGEGNDTLIGGIGNDSLFGGDNNDFLEGGSLVGGECNKFYSRVAANKNEWRLTA